MNIVNKLTFRHIKENMWRCLVTIFGICISVAMITAVFVGAASFLRLEGDIAYRTEGHVDVFMSVNKSQREKLLSDERIKTLGTEITFENKSFYLENSTSARKGIGDIYFGDETNLKQMFTKDFEGEIPKNENEIAVEKSLIEENNLDWQIGDTVEIPIGYRYITQDGETTAITGGYVGGEEFYVNDIKEYKITAILDENPATSYYQIICGYDIQNLANLEDEEYSLTATAQLKEINFDSLDVIDDILEDYSIDDYTINKDYITSYFVIEEGSLFATMLPMMLIMLAIIVVASVALIYNAFAMSASERVRYLGMLASVGATKKQKRASVYFEGLILGAIGIPIGIGAGVLGIGITLKMLGAKIISTSMLTGVDESMKMPVVVPWWAVVGIVFFSVLTIFISSLIPSRKASSITPIDAIRQRQEIKIKSKKLKSPKIVRKIFGYEGELAYKNLKRNGKKSRVITISIALSLILFLSCNYFCSLFTESLQIQEQLPYQLTVSCDKQYKDELDSIVSRISGVEDAYSVSNINYYARSDGDGAELFNDDYLTKDGEQLMTETEVVVYINYIDDEMFNQICEDNGIDYSDFYSDGNKMIVLNSVNHSSKKIFNDNIKSVSVFGYEIAGCVDYEKDNSAFELNPKYTISFYIPYSAYTDTQLYVLGIETETHEQTHEELLDELDASSIDSYYTSDLVESLNVMNTVVFIIEVLVYGFISLITLITLANIINTISTGILLRKKEFAMLKSVGTTPKGFNKMIMLESAFYGIRAVVFAVPISILVSYIMNDAVSTGYPFSIDYLLYLAAILVVFVVIGITMLYSVRRLKNDSIIETLKEEIN